MIDLPHKHRPIKIVSGGQTGADQAALAAATSLGIATGGWVPKGWRTATGSAPWLADFGCVEHMSHEWAPRTTANVRDSDGTVWFGKHSPGYWCTRSACERQKRAFIENPTPDELRRFLWNLNDHPHLNVAGNREHLNPGIGEHVIAVLLEALS